jgi:predicted RecB family nuclease
MWADDGRFIESDISLLDGLRAETRTALRRAGIDTVHQLAALSVEELRAFKGVGKVTAPAIKAHAQAWMEQRAVWYGSLRATCHQSGFMFDLETDGFTHVPWCFGWEDADGTAYAAVVSPDHRETRVTLSNGHEIILVSSSDALWEIFAAMTVETECPVYHWGYYDKGILRSTAPWEVRAQLEDRMHNLHDTFKRAVKFPRRGTSLKETAAHLNFAWSSYQDWMAAYLDYRRWLASGDIEALSRACSYQQDDVRALGLVWRWLVDNAPEREG